MDAIPAQPRRSTASRLSRTLLLACGALCVVLATSLLHREPDSLGATSPASMRMATRSGVACPAGLARMDMGASQQSRRSRFAAPLRSFSSAEAQDEASQQNKGTLLVVGATGTLGRQIVRRALSDGYQVRCFVRSRFESEEARRVLQGWGATIVGGDLGQATSIPPAMLGVDAVIDCATARPEEPLRRVDWDGKTALIETAQALGIERYIFFSIDKCDQYPGVKLMDMKAKTEQFLEQTNLNYTVFRMCGFMQALISSYAIPIVEGENVWGTSSGSEIAYINSLDAARLALAAVENEDTYRETMTLAGPGAYTTKQVIELCEKYSGSEAKVINAPGFFLQSVRSFLGLFKWAQDAADRLAFAEVISQNTVLSADMKKTCEVLKVDPESLTSLPDYLESFFNTILSKVQKIKKSEFVSSVARDLEI